MLRRLISLVGFPSVALAGLLLLVDPVQARDGRGSGGDRGRGGRESNRGWGGGYRGGYYGFGSYPLYGGYRGFYSPFYGGYYGYYGPDYYDYYDGYYPRARFFGQRVYHDNYLFDSGSVTDGAYYGSTDTSSGNSSNAVLIDVKVPANAELWFDDAKTSQTGSMRQFASPPLDSEHNYSYEIRARWTENGRTVERTKNITVRPGQHLAVDMQRGPDGIRTPALGENNRGDSYRDQEKRRPQTPDNRPAENQKKQAPNSSKNNAGTPSNNPIP
jgi:uncharacterized protein (TIGR03000 family)